MERVKLNNGRTMPILGLGTWLCTDEADGALRDALDAGYRHIDTAFQYGNEQAIGNVLQEYFKDGRLKREDVFITTKLWITHLKKNDVPINCAESLKRLKLDYIDMYLIHWPFAFKNRGDGTLMPFDDNGKIELDSHPLTDTWKAMEELVDAGKVRSIGVSNFNSEQTERICTMARIPPTMNQVECNAYFPQNELFNFCKQRNIYITAYAPLGSSGRPEEYKAKDEKVLLNETVLSEIGKKYGKSPAQVLIRNLVQRDIIVIPKSKTASRIKDNIAVFDFTLSDEDMEQIALLNTKKRLVAMAFVKHAPEYPFDLPF